MAKVETLQQNQAKTSFIVKCFGDKNITHVVTLIGVILLFIAGVYIYIKLRRTKVALESCQSSCSSLAAP